MIATTLSLSISLDTAFAASTLSLLLSTTTNSTFFPNTSPFASLANLIPSTVISPPAACAPVIGSNTPIFMTSSEEPLPVSCGLPQPVKDAVTNTKTSKNRLSFFFILKPPYYNI